MQHKEVVFIGRENGGEADVSGGVSALGLAVAVHNDALDTELCRCTELGSIENGKEVAEVFDGVSIDGDNNIARSQIGPRGGRILIRLNTEMRLMAVRSSHCLLLPSIQGRRGGWSPDRSAG
jgi:hypothetical protein